MTFLSQIINVLSELASISSFEWKKEKTTGQQEMLNASKGLTEK